MNDPSTPLGDFQNPLTDKALLSEAEGLRAYGDLEAPIDFFMII
jgi:hypothetical protein